MTDWTARAIAHLDAQEWADWDVIPGQFTEPDARVCGRYLRASAAYIALRDAGYEPTANFIPSPPLHPHYDLRTVMRFCPAGGDPGSQGVLLVRLARETGS